MRVSPTVQSPQGQPLHVVLVDDDPVWRYLTGTALRERGWTVDDCESGAALLEAVAQRVPDIALVDALMPEMDGFEACRRLRAAAGSELPILVLTSLEDELSIRSAYEAGATDFFIKSTHWALLVERIRHLVQIVEMGRQLHRSNEHLARVHTSAGAGVCDYDFSTRMLYGAPGSFCVLGFDGERTQLHMHEFRRLLDRAELQRLDEAITRSSDAHEPLGIQLKVRTPCGESRSLKLEGEFSLDADERVRVIRCVFRDLTEDLNTRRELQRLSSHDALTGLPNRARFLSELSEAIRVAGAGEQRVAVAVIDMDRFTQINETLGQVAGDELLCLMGERIRDALAPLCAGAQGPEPFLARLPGDEFALLVPRVRSLAEVDELMRAVMQELQRSCQVAQTECFVSASIGVALFPRDGDAAGILLSRADRAAREVKARGRNDFAWYLPSLNRDSRSRLEMVAGLHKALERDEFELHFQPWVDVANGRVTGLEALLRWRREGRPIPPGDFIPVAEDTGLIIPIGEWVLQTAAARLAEWRRLGVVLERVAVNVPTVHFERDSLLTTLRTAMHVHRLEPQSIELELTETCMVRDFERTLPQLEALIDAGATLAIDDFGTGYSSLAYLTRLPISKLKVDRAFVSELGVSRQGGAVCRAIVALGQSLGVQVLAEGVETQAQAAALLGIGCRVMQGFLFSRPVPAPHVPAAIAAAQAVARTIGQAAASSVQPARVPSADGVTTGSAGAAGAPQASSTGSQLAQGVQR